TRLPRKPCGLVWSRQLTRIRRSRRRRSSTRSRPTIWLPCGDDPPQGRNHATGYQAPLAAPRRAVGRQGPRRDEQPNDLELYVDPVGSAAAVFAPPRRRRVRGVLLYKVGRRAGVRRAIRWGAFASGAVMRGPRLNVERRQVLQLLSSSPDGLT